MRAKRTVRAGAVAGLAASVLLLGGALRGSPSTGSAQVAPPPAPAAAGDSATQVAKLQAALRANPDDVYGLDSLGLAYQQRARETGDPTYYTKSDEVLRRALRLSPRDLLATSGLGSLALSRHRFREALVLGRRARAISPTTARNYGVIGDALVELGRYREGFKAFDRMASMRPDVSSYGRIAHARVLIGDVPGAISVFRMALDASLGQGEVEAWSHVQLSKTLFSVGKLAPALAQAREGLRAFPGYAPAYDALAWAEYGQGHARAAIAAEQEAVNRTPLPQYVAMLGDLQRASGQKAQARRQYALIGVIERLLVANGVKTDLETALFDVDHSIRLQASLALARRAQRERPSIDGDDVLSWALERTGHCGDALRLSKRALRLGTLDALKFFHRGMIERCLGDRAAARQWFSRALALNPRFSVLWAAVARRELR
jgi:tetratricopeptide (TPR) repeat protein